MKSLVTFREGEPRFRRRLAAELASRCAKNAQYSLRAFAKFLEIDHSSLSQILRGRRTLTERTIRRLGAKLDLEEEAIDRFVAVERIGRDGDVQREMERLTSDTVELLADWHHFAILELCSVEGFEADSRWVARALDLSVDEVNMAVQRLLRLGLMRMEGKRWLDTTGQVYGDIDDFHQAGIQRLAAQLRELSFAAMNDAPSQRREYTVATLGISTKKLPEAFALIERLRDEIAGLFEEESKDDVYKLEINFYPVTKLGMRDKEE